MSFSHDDPRGVRGSDDGFTLIELSVVVLIIDVLLAAAIPTFLSARLAAQDRSAQSELTSALTTAKVVYSDSGSWPAWDGNPSFATIVDPMNDAEPALEFVSWFDAPVTADGQIHVGAVDNFVAVKARSETGTLYCIYDTGTDSYAGYTPGTYYLSGPSTSDNCNQQGW
jgi:prepilin-type N-terminal cleavage/methylation domain-containing protein